MATASGVTHERPRRLLGLLGAECTGKSILAADLAESFAGATVVPEALRAFVDRHGRAPLAHEQAGILAEQRDAVESALDPAPQGHGIVIADPMPLMTAVYSLAYFDDDSLLATALDDARRYSLVAWCRPDFPWSPDGAQRDGPQWRARVDDLLTTWILPRLTEVVPVVEARGPRHERLGLVRQAWHPSAADEST